LAQSQGVGADNLRLSTNDDLTVRW